MSSHIFSESLLAPEPLGDGIENKVSVILQATLRQIDVKCVEVSEQLSWLVMKKASHKLHQKYVHDCVCFYVPLHTIHSQYWQLL